MTEDDPTEHSPVETVETLHAALGVVNVVRLHDCGDMTGDDVGTALDALVEGGGGAQAVMLAVAGHTLNLAERIGALAGVDAATVLQGIARQLSTALDQ